MNRILLIVIVLFAAWRLLSAIGRRAASSGHGADSYSRFSPQARRRRRAAAEGTGSPGPPEQLIPCAGCGTFVPAGRALPVREGEVACSDECRGALEREHA